MTTPDKTSSPTSTLLGTDSPVKLAVSNILFPLITLPSNGTFSPTLTTIVSPTCTSSGVTWIIWSSITIVAYSLLISIKEEIDDLVLLTAYPWKISPIA